MQIVFQLFIFTLLVLVKLLKHIVNDSRNELYKINHCNKSIQEMENVSNFNNKIKQKLIKFSSNINTNLVRHINRMKIVLSSPCKA